MNDEIQTKQFWDLIQMKDQKINTLLLEKIRHKDEIAAKDKEIETAIEKAKEAEKALSDYMRRYP